MRHDWVMALPVALLACGNQNVENSRFADHVARQFTADCRRPHAPTPARARQLDRLCSCAAARIRSSGIVFGDSNDAINAQVHAAMEACSREVQG
jgi:hypothetical protein